MGIIRRQVRFGTEDGSTWASAEAFIDTGAVHCQVSSTVASQLNARLFRSSSVSLADGSVQERDIVYVLLEIDPSQPRVLTTAAVGNDNAPFLVGAVALEQLGLGVDPSTQKLVPELPVLLQSLNWPTIYILG